MSKNLLLEIGTEEVPAHVMPGILKELKEKAEKALQENRVDFENVRTIGTPRRTALLVTGLAESQEDVESENRGPSVQIAFDADGNPTKAAQGFARGQKVDPKDLVVKDGYVYAMVHEKGQAAAELLKTILPELISSLSFPNNMRWRDLDFKFIRPLRWIVALLGSEVIPFEVAEVQSGRVSRGHRFLSPTKDKNGEFEIADADSYEQACEAQFIIVDQERRKAMIREQIVETAKANGGQAEISEDLLEEVLYLVEYPTALCGKFDDKYLALPPETVITPMRDHQRYFPVKSAEGKLLPLFITVRNGGKEHLETVQHGNERVLRARLEDAQFFFDEDRKKSLEEHREKLKTVVFQQGLGNMYEKSERLAELSELKADEKTAKHAHRAAILCKADLVTGMVTEFTELQGIMGREYAKLDGECEKVAAAIDEHYMPRFAGDSQPQSEAGRIVSTADKIDTIVGTFSRGKIPTGSQDPFALRRQALGLVNMMIEAKWQLSLSKVVAKSMDLYGITDEAARQKMQQDVADFMRLRLKNVLEEVRYDVVDAVLADVDDLYAVSLRAQAVQKFVSGDAVAHIQALVRASNLAAKAEKEGFEESLFQVEAEKTLGQVCKATASSVESLIAGQDYVGAIDALTELTQPIDKFFEDVMVMDKDEAIRNNRLGLLKSIDALAGRVADFSKIVLA